GITVSAIAPAAARTAKALVIRLTDATDRTPFVWSSPRSPDPHELLDPDQEQRDADEEDPAEPRAGEDGDVADPRHRVPDASDLAAGGDLPVLAGVVRVTLGDEPHA